MCLGGATRLPADCWWSELSLQNPSIGHLHHLFLYWFYSIIIYCVNTVYNAGPHCKLVCITKCAIHSVEIKDIIIIIISSNTTCYDITVKSAYLALNNNQSLTPDIYTRMYHFLNNPRVNGLFGGLISTTVNSNTLL